MANERGPAWGQHPLRAIIAGAAVAGYSWLAGGIASFTAAATVAVAIPWVVFAVLAYWWRQDRIPPPEGLDITGASYWAIVVVMFLEWEAAGFKDGSNWRHPTLSIVAGPLMQHHAVKSAVFAAWLLGGWGLIRR
jgi:hypothetical protein